MSDKRKGAAEARKEKLLKELRIWFEYYPFYSDKWRFLPAYWQVRQLIQHQHEKRRDSEMVLKDHDKRSSVCLLVPGEPQGKQRPRISKFGTYTPKKTVNYETYIKELFVIRYPDFIPLEGALIIELGIWQSIPVSTSKKKRDLMLKKPVLLEELLQGVKVQAIIRPTKRPDVDNVLKIVMDALEGLAFKNDNQIATVLASKFYSDQPRLKITIERL